MAHARPEAGGSALRQRIASGALLGAVAVGAVALGGWWFTAALLLTLILAAWEWARLAPHAAPPCRTLLALAPLLIGGIAVIATSTGAHPLAWASLLLGAPLAAAIAALLPGCRPHRTAVGVLYLGVPLAVLAWLRAEPQIGTGLVLWLLAVVAATDTAAYAAGRSIGGIRLAPVISPGKTWAGLGGGVGAAAAVGAAGGPLLGWNWAISGALAAVLAVVAQAGDLFESWLKRRAGLKDSGALLPGHGGLLDRIDGLLLAASALGVVWALRP